MRSSLACATLFHGALGDLFLHLQSSFKHPGKTNAPKCFLCHLRIPRCLQRGAEGKVILKELPMVLVAPGFRPPAESLKDVQHAEFFQRFEKVQNGSKAWKSQALKQGFQLSAVSHVCMQSAKHVRPKKLLTSVQKFDSWSLLNKCHDFEREVQTIDAWPSTCWTLSKVSCPDGTYLWLRALESAWQVGQRKHSKYFSRAHSKHGKHRQNRKSMRRLAPAMRISIETLPPETIML